MQRILILFCLGILLSCNHTCKKTKNTEKKIILKAARPAEIGYSLLYLYDDSSFVFLNCAFRICDSFKGKYYFKEDTGYMIYQDSICAFLGEQIIIHDSIVDNINSSYNLKLKVYPKVVNVE